MEMTPRLDRFFKVPLLDYLRLRPYGDQLVTPAVTVWLGFAWVVILLMASLEGIVWGLVGASIVPEGVAWLRPLAGLFMCLLIFAIIWIVDASLIMSERPLLRARFAHPGGQSGPGALLRWTFGLAVRLCIVAISLYVTAPLLAKLIRADDIAGYHQRQVEQYHAQREATVEAQLRDRAREIEVLYRERVQPIEAQIERLTQSLAAERQRLTQIESEYAPEIAVLRSELTAAQASVGDEVHGRDNRLPGYGPEARKWEARANKLGTQLAAKQKEIDARTATVNQAIADLEQRLRALTDDLQRLRLEQQQRLDQAAAEVTAQQPEALPPRLTFAARSMALKALRDSPDERGVPHFETVEGFAQAALAILFFALIALKLFEPPAVRAYFSETLQMQYRKYLEGGLAEIPGFELSEDLKGRLNPVEFVRLWRAYERDPSAFYAEYGTLLEAREPLLQWQAERTLEHELLARRQDNVIQELEFARRQRERELLAYDEELTLRAAHLKAELAHETSVRQDQHRVKLAAELQQARDAWELHKAREEEELRQRQESFARSQELAREDRRLREKEMEQLHQQRMEELRQAEIASEREHQQQTVNQELVRHREAQETRLTRIREELSRLRELEARQDAELESLREAARKLDDAITVATDLVKTAESELAARRAQAESLTQAVSAPAPEPPKGRLGFWLRATKGTDTKTLRDAKRDLKLIAKGERAELERLARQRDELRSFELRRTTLESELRRAEARIAATQSRIVYYEDGIRALLLKD